MDVDQISAPFEFKDPYGEIAFRVLMLQSRTEPHKASLEKDYSRIKDNAMILKKDNELNNWVGKNIKETLSQ
jgi:peptidyl-prolyl cis-trans isomerase SurA